ncbi:MAG: hypothetical protein JRJ19_00430 [Deltaproteobacteria bacterium]|nr:hypothetical protein [Deltaproteobacteria bacterium]MBW1870497.1 hypothetical protein [Deltaproteobacteria bacterium]
MRYRIIFLFFLVAGFISGCPSHTLLTVQDQQKIQSQQKNKTYYLKQSFFAGPFFAYDDRFFISERAFDERVLIESIGGDPILSSDPTGVIPLGTEVNIREVEFPTSSAVSDRKLKSPRHFTWVMIDIKDKPKKTPYVLVLTQEFKKISDFDRSLAVYLVKDDPSDEFIGLAQEVLEAVNTKKIVKGMRADALLRSRGHPDKISRKVVDGARIEQWQYAPERIVVLKEDLVESWKGFPDLDLDLLVTPKNRAEGEPVKTPEASDIQAPEKKPDVEPSSTESP